jgi:hypothetical protein
MTNGESEVMQASLEQIKKFVTEWEPVLQVFRDNPVVAPAIHGMFSQMQRDSTIVCSIRRLLHERRGELAGNEFAERLASDIGAILNQPSAPEQP